MAGVGSKWWYGTSSSRLRGKILIGFIVAISTLTMAVAEPSLKLKDSFYNGTQKVEPHHGTTSQSGYKHLWPDMKFGWKTVVGTIITFLGAACGSVGGVGGGGIFVPMLTLIVGFDSKSSAAISKCMITGAAASTVLYNIRLRHPTLELPIIDYDLALLFQPMLILGISIGVTLNVLFSDWMITILLIIIFGATSAKAFFKGVETWKKETKSKQEAASVQLDNSDNEIEAAEENAPPGGTTSQYQIKSGSKKEKVRKVSITENVYWKELGILVAVWLIILALQIGKNYSTTCSVEYWLLNTMQIPVAVGVTSYVAVSLYKGRRKIASKGEARNNWPLHRLLFYCVTALMAGTVGGMLGLGGGFILGPLFLEMGIPPQVSSATAAFAMMFSASISVVEFYLLKRFPVPYALYFFVVATISAVVGQHVAGKLIRILGRASLIIFTLAFIIFASAILLGGVGIGRSIKQIERNEYMGFENICS
ncbi:sulfite exporter TauE/SafE family protein 3-like [Populus nigra]|uniref:sulfite exporter TauE/SafE family protein 3-like n=1 Tax=Populus nigra TaxID=3691 RepID=UPI002B275607|nr:sulfite exporter TauE/SafE family protein 3-like [Populus nigra]